jgi:hypothetical protein
MAAVQADVRAVEAGAETGGTGQVTLILKYGLNFIFFIKCRYF